MNIVREEAPYQPIVRIELGNTVNDLYNFVYFEPLHSSSRVKMFVRINGKDDSFTNLGSYHLDEIEQMCAAFRVDQAMKDTF